MVLGWTAIKKVGGGLVLSETVFQRVEKKYKISASTRQKIESLLRGKMAPDAYGNTYVSSLYFDTPTRGIIARSLEKPLYKEKLRLRVYGQENVDVLPAVFMQGVAGAGFSNIAVFAEMKKKYKGIVYKRRVKMSAPAVRAWFAGADIETAMSEFPLMELCALEDETSAECVTGGALAAENPACTQQFQMKQVVPTAKDIQISHEIDAMRARWEGIEPAMLICCNRVAWAPVLPQTSALAANCTATNAEAGASFNSGAPLATGVAANLEEAQVTPSPTNSVLTQALFNSDVRITFDTNLTYSLDGHAFVPVCDSSESIMEIKCSGAYPSWLVEILNATAARPSSFSKYGTAARLAWGA